MRRTLAPWRRTAAGSGPDGALSALLVGAWLTLTVAFAVGGVALVGTVVTALGQPRGVPTFLVTLAGALGACGVAPTLAEGVVARSLERVAAYLDRGDDVASGSRPFSRSETGGRASCRGSRGCCC